MEKVNKLLRIILESYEPSEPREVGNPYFYGYSIDEYGVVDAGIDKYMMEEIMRLHGDFIDNNFTHELNKLGRTIFKIRD